MRESTTAPVSALVGAAILELGGELVDEACGLPWWAWRRRRRKLRQAALAGRLGVMLHRSA